MEEKLNILGRVQLLEWGTSPWVTSWRNASHNPLIPLLSVSMLGGPEPEAKLTNELKQRSMVMSMFLIMTVGRVVIAAKRENQSHTILIHAYCKDSQAIQLIPVGLYCNI